MIFLKLNGTKIHFKILRQSLFQLQKSVILRIQLSFYSLQILIILFTADGLKFHLIFSTNCKINYSNSFSFSCYFSRMARIKHFRS